jgi:Zinc finger, C3HC4 type (RING finger)
MSYAYLDPSRAVLEMTLEALGGFAMAPGARTDVPEIPAVPCELDQSWSDFEKELGNFKRKLARVKRDMNIKMSQIQEVHKSSTIAKMILDNVPSEDLKTRLASVIDSYESQEGLDGLTLQYGKLKGEYDAMKKVLENTDPERYAKFTCCICMDRLVDLFLDPCGHVVCEPCWASTRSKTTCPGCRSRIVGARKIFTMS